MNPTELQKEIERLKLEKPKLPELKQITTKLEEFSDETKKYWSNPNAGSVQQFPNGRWSK